VQHRAIFDMKIGQVKSETNLFFNNKYFEEKIYLPPIPVASICFPVIASFSLHPSFEDRL
jgi:hypothetical protein